MFPNGVLNHLHCASKERPSHVNNLGFFPKKFQKQSALAFKLQNKPKAQKPVLEILYFQLIFV